MISNPYFNTGFFEFFAVLLKRIFGFITGELSFDNLVTDEIQLITLCLISLSLALIGTFLILRKMSMLANALSHTILIGIVGAFFAAKLFIPFHGEHSIPSSFLMIAAVLTGIVTTFATQILTHNLRLQEDASIGVVFTSLFALGIVLINLLTRNAHIGIELLMGNVDALSREDLSMILMVLLIDLVFVLLFFKPLVVTSFDPGFAVQVGYSLPLTQYLLMSVAALTMIASFRACGVIMVLAFLTAPVLTARCFVDSLKPLILLSALIGVVISVLSVAISRHILTFFEMGISTGGITVCILALICLVSLISKRMSRKKIAF